MRTMPKNEKESGSRKAYFVFYSLWAVLMVYLFYEYLVATKKKRLWDEHNAEMKLKGIRNERRQMAFNMELERLNEAFA